MYDIVMQKIVVAVAFTPMIWVLYAIMRSYAKPMRNIVLGVTLPYEHITDDDVSRIAKTYRAHLLRVALLCTIAFVPVFFLGDPLGIYAATVLWIMVSACALQIPYIRGHAAMRRVKRSYDMPSETGRLRIDTQVSAHKGRGALPIGFFAIPFTIGMIPVVWELLIPRGRMLVALAPTLSTLVMFALYLLFRHARSRTPSGDTETNMAINKNVMGRWTHFAFQASLSNLMMLVYTYAVSAGLLPSNDFLMIVIVLSCAFYLVYTLLRTIFHARQTESQLLARSVPATHSDDDDRWLLGMFYYNPHDAKVFMAHRMGTGMGLNYAKPFAKAVIVFIALIFVVHLAMMLAALQ